MTAFAVFSRFRKIENLSSKVQNVIHRKFTDAKSRRFILPEHNVFMKLISLHGEEHASAIFKHIKENITCDDDNTPVMEMRAGEGLLTEKLLLAGIKNLHVFERRNLYLPKLQALLSKYPGNNMLHSRTFNQVFFEDNNFPLYDSSYLESSLPFQCHKAWDDTPSVKIILTHQTSKVLPVCISHVSKNMMFRGMGRPQFIVTLPAQAWNDLSSKTPKSNSYHASAYLFPDLYEMDILGSISPPVLFIAGDASVRVLKEEVLTVSITASKELAEHVSPELLEEYLFFGTQTMNGRAKHSYVIKSLESWAAGSGRDLVVNGVDCFTQLMDLCPKEALRIFKIWRSLPHFDTSLFKYEFEKYIQCNK
ncbi:hypothetical protein ONE63_006770 [Megalurothrips usitatus]|uniref:rRNA adenine N(6)-methyltransferase n=1 Tax=Megalurothrips usitatus TaxID=439358 RepID=A0AAV7XPX9_9NEOP|nr:hypothetical protein ONE63_006770 [Megalurothrips usitatus]